MSFTAAATTFLSLLSFIKFTGPDNVEKKEWKRHDQVLKVRLAQLHNDIAHAPVDNVAYIEALGDTLTSEICQLFLENIEFFESDYSSSSSNKFIAHKNSTISQLEDQKKKLRAAAFGPNGSEEKRKEFYQCLQAIGELKKREKKKQEAKTTLYHEKQFFRNRYKYSKEIVNGTFGQENEELSCDKATADHFYSATYS